MVKILLLNCFVAIFFLYDFTAIAQDNREDFGVSNVIYKTEKEPKYLLVFDIKDKTSTCKTPYFRNIVFDVPRESYFRRPDDLINKMEAYDFSWDLGCKTDKTPVDGNGKFRYKLRVLFNDGESNKYWVQDRIWMNNGQLAQGPFIFKQGRNNRSINGKCYELLENIGHPIANRADCKLYYEKERKYKDQKLIRNKSASHSLSSSINIKAEPIITGSKKDSSLNTKLLSGDIRKVPVSIKYFISPKDSFPKLTTKSYNITIGYDVELSHYISAGYIGSYKREKIYVENDVTLTPQNNFTANGTVSIGDLAIATETSALIISGRIELQNIHIIPYATKIVEIK